MITREDLYRLVALNPQDPIFDKIYYDIWGIEERLKKRAVTYPDSLNKVLNFILTCHQMWHDVGNADPKTQAERFSGFQPLCKDKEHNELNPVVNERDYLFVFKEYMRKWASRKNEGTNEANWYKMQDELAEQIVRWPHEIRKEEVA